MYTGSRHMRFLTVIRVICIHRLILATGASSGGWTATISTVSHVVHSEVQRIKRSEVSCGLLPEMDNGPFFLRGFR